MPTPAEHFIEAETYLEAARCEPLVSDAIDALLAFAQVHALLANVTPTADLGTALQARDAAPTLVWPKVSVLSELDADAAVRGDGRAFLIVLLKAGETAWNPTSTKDSPLIGPAEVIYQRYADGGIDVRVV